MMTITTKRKVESEFHISAISPKKARLLAEEDGSESDHEDNFKVNEDYAKKYQHNKERAEKHRLEEKYGKTLGEKNDQALGDSSSEDETEDDDGQLADEDVDAEISATLEAIRSRDPRIYQKDAKFYTTLEKKVNAAPRSAGDQPMYLRDYHRKNLLENGGENTTNGAEPEQLPYAQQQEVLKASIIREMHAADEEAGNEASDEDSFLVRKEVTRPARSSKPQIPDPKTADENPETFLSNFFESRAWVPTDTSQFAPLESDDDEELARAEEFENAWNLRFEDPETTNRTIPQRSRATVDEYSVRRKELGGRKKARELEKERKQEQKKEFAEEKKRLRNLKISEIEQRVEKIREAAGLSGSSTKIEEWVDLLEGDFDDDEWNQQMSSRFGENYYQEEDDTIEISNKARKPKWKDDIDITDVAPEFHDDIDPIKEFRDSEDEQDEKSQNTAVKNKSEAKRQARRDRRIIEALADQALPLDAELEQSSKTFAPFRYRDTSPNTFGLTPLDILAAEDSQLNQYAGLKKLATFRDSDRKKKDRSKLSKRARLRAWRRDTFGREDGPAPETIYAPGTAMAAAMSKATGDAMPGAEPTGASGKKRKRKNKKAKATTSNGT